MRLTRMETRHREPRTPAILFLVRPTPIFHTSHRAGVAHPVWLVEVSREDAYPAEEFGESSKDLWWVGKWRPVYSKNSKHMLDELDADSAARPVCAQSNGPVLVVWSA